MKTSAAKLVASLFLFLLIGTTAKAAQHTYTCTDWVVNGGGSGSCTGDVITFTATDNYVTDGTYNGTTNSGFTISNGVTYYIAWETNSGTYNQAHVQQEYGGAQTNIATFTFGTGANQASFVGTSGTNVKLMFDNNGGGGAGTVEAVCISDVSYDDCLNPGGSTTTPTTTLTEINWNQPMMAIGWLIMVIMFFGTIWVITKKHKLDP